MSTQGESNSNHKNLQEDIDKKLNNNYAKNGSRVIDINIATALDDCNNDDNEVVDEVINGYRIVDRDETLLCNENMNVHVEKKEEDEKHSLKKDNDRKEGEENTPNADIKVIMERKEEEDEEKVKVKGEDTSTTYASNFKLHQEQSNNLNKADLSPLSSLLDHPNYRRGRKGCPQVHKAAVLIMDNPGMQPYDALIQVGCDEVEASDFKKQNNVRTKKQRLTAKLQNGIKNPDNHEQEKKNQNRNNVNGSEGKTKKKTRRRRGKNTAKLDAGSIVLYQSQHNHYSQHEDICLPYLNYSSSNGPIWKERENKYIQQLRLCHEKIKSLEGRICMLEKTNSKLIDEISLPLKEYILTRSSSKKKNKKNMYKNKFKYHQMNNNAITTFPQHNGNNEEDFPTSNITNDINTSTNANDSASSVEDAISSGSSSPKKRKDKQSSDAGALSSWTKRRKKGDKNLSSSLTDDDMDDDIDDNTTAANLEVNIDSKFSSDSGHDDNTDDESVDRLIQRSNDIISSSTPLKDYDSDNDENDNSSEII